MLNDKDIKNTFLDSSLEDESWLEPSDAVFDNIEQAIYPEEDDKKPWLFWTAGLSVLSLAIVVIFLMTGKETGLSKNNQTLSKATEASSPIEKVAEKPSQNQRLTKPLVITNPVEDVVGTVQSSATSINKLDNRTTIMTASNTVIDKINSGTNNKTNNKATPTIATEIAPSTAASRANGINNKIPNSNQVTKQGLSNIRAATPAIGKEEKNQFSEVVPFSILPILQASLLNKTTETPVHSQNLFATTDGPFGTTISYGLGASSWRFILNDNYNAALDPADFEHDPGRSISFHLGFEKQVSANLSLKLQATYDNVSFRSGHNSNISYNQSAEQNDPSNNFDLTVATPIGIIQNQITVGRNQMTSAEEQDLLIVLDNNHQFRNIDLTFSSLYNLYRSSSWNLNTEFGIGGSYSFDFRNELSEVLFEETAYSISDVNQSTTQTDINNWRPHVSLSFSTAYQLKSGVELSLSYMYKNDLSSIFSADDFSTRLVRHQLFFSSKKRF